MEDKKKKKKKRTSVFLHDVSIRKKGPILNRFDDLNLVFLFFFFFFFFFFEADAMEFKDGVDDIYTR